MVIAIQTQLFDSLKPGLTLLLRVHETGCELGEQARGLAIGLPVLNQVRLADVDLRFLLSKGLVERIGEPPSPGRQRSNEESAAIPFDIQTRFRLTSAGVSFAQQLLTGAPRGRRVDLVPFWDLDHRELSLGGLLVKAFNRPSDNQIAVLTEFQHDGWSPRIDDPLPGKHGLEPRRRLNDTIKSLNKNQVNALIRFRGDGSGEGIRWDLLGENLPSPHGDLGRASECRLLQPTG